MQIILQLFLLVLGFVMLIKGADWFVDGASGIADRLGIPPIIIGLTIVAMGTSAPEAAISISSALKGSADIAVGNVIGSNILNVLIILGVTSVIVPVAVNKTTIRYEIPFVILITAVFAALGLYDGRINITDGFVLILLFIIYLSYLFVMAKKSWGGQNHDGGERVKRKMPRLLAAVVIGCAVIVLGSNVAVDAASEIAKICGMSERFIGLTIVALGTSLPELVTSVMAACKGNADIAIGNIVGSNIFNILFVIGISSVITPVIYQREFFADSLICIGSVVLLLLLLLNREHSLKRWGGIIMLLGYAGYFVYLIG